MRALQTLSRLVLLAVAGVILSSYAAFAAAVEVRVKDGVGSYLSDDRGMALYVFKKDAPDKSVCGAANGCIDKWPAFFVENLEQRGDLKAADFGVIKRDDGKQQITFRGMPLYFFFKDAKPGDINGQGVNNVWFLAVP